MTTKKTSKTWQQRFHESVTDYNKLKLVPLVPLDTTKNITTDHLTYLGGFVEGEGSININIRTSPTARFGIFVDPEFGLYQSNRNIQHLFTLCRHLKVGTVYVGTLKKTALDETKHVNYDKASFRVGSRKDLLEKVIPFIKKYVIPHAGLYYQNRFQLWSQAIELFDKQVHLTAVGMYEQMIPLVIQLRVITPRSDASTPLTTVDDAREFLMDVICKKLNAHNVDISGLTDLAICKKFDRLFPNQQGGRN